jgi:NADH:ubiquinone oxidoreductase subunit E
MSDRQEQFPALLETLRPQCQALIAQYEDSRSALLPMMHLFQKHEGFVSTEAMNATAQMLQITPAVVESTVSFYTLFFRRPVGKYMINVCRGLACSVNGAEEIMAYVRRTLGIGHLETTDDGLFSYEEVECLAACDKPTCAQVNLEFVYSLTPQVVDDMIAAMRGGTYAVAPLAQTDAPGRTWKVRQEAEVSTGRKSAGARDVVSPNNAGGVGDGAGTIMLDRIVLRDDFRGRSLERVIQEPTQSLKELVESETDAGVAH